MPRNRGARTSVFVTIGTLKYGFAAGANSTPYRAELGHTAYTNQAGVFFGANSPKPNRASKVFAAGTISSFCDPSKEADLRTANWVVTRAGSRRGIKTAGRTRTVFVEMPGGYNYAWNITATEATDHATILGQTQATATTANLIWGSTPKPPRATKLVGGSQVSSFIEPRPAIINAAIADGWSISGVDYDLLPDV